MGIQPSAAADSKPLHRITIGELCVSRTPAIIQTLLGSCVSACLFDPVARVGGMNHIFLPGDPDLVKYDKSARFGINAMEILINRIMRKGGQRDRLKAKIFGGAQMLRSMPEDVSTGLKNSRFVESFLGQEQIPILARDLGGTDTRILYFHTDTGEVMLRRLRQTQTSQILEAERKLRAKVRAELEKDVDITLFS